MPGGIVNNDQPTEVPEEVVTVALAAYDRAADLPAITRAEMRSILKAAKVAHLDGKLQAIRNLAILFTEEADPNYKDHWEAGHDAGMATAGRQLSNLLDSIGVPK